MSSSAIESEPSTPTAATPSSNGATNSPSFLSHIAYPVSYTVSGLLRRLSQDDAPTPLARALSANFNGMLTDPTNGVYHPPARRLSPFQPPPLTPLTLSGWREGTSRRARLLSKSLAEEIRLLVPPRLQLVDQWRLAYSLEQDGTSLASLYGLCGAYRGKRGGLVLVVRDGGGGVFGAYLSDPPHPAPHYYGTGECFLWRAFRLPAMPELASLPPPPSEDTTHAQRMTTIGGVSKTSSSASLVSLNVPTNGRGSRTTSPMPAVSRGEAPIRFKAFPYTGENDYTILCSQDFLSVGGGNGKYGLWLDDRMAKGVSAGCPTFENEPLSEEGEKFDILGVEIWYLGS